MQRRASSQRREGGPPRRLVVRRLAALLDPLPWQPGRQRNLGNPVHLWTTQLPSGPVPDEHRSLVPVGDGGLRGRGADGGHLVPPAP